MEILNIQANEQKSEVIEVIQSMARLRGKHCKIDELVVVRTEDHGLAEAIVQLLGTENVKRARLTAGKTDVPAPSVTSTCSPADETSEVRGVPFAPLVRSSVKGSFHPRPPTHAPMGEAPEPPPTKSWGIRVRFCKRCMDQGRETPLEKGKQYCPDHRTTTSNPAGKYRILRGGIYAEK